MAKRQKKSKIIFEKPVEEKNGFAKSKINPKTAQETIPFDEVYENGIFRFGDRFSIIFKIDNVNYSIMRENEKDQFYEKYKHFLNTIPQNINYQEFIMNYPIDKKTLSDTIVPKNRTIPDGAVYEDYRKYMNEIVADSISSACDRIILGALSFVPKTKLDDVNILFKYAKAIGEQCLNLGTKVAVLAPEQSFEIIHRLYHLYDNEIFLLPTRYLQADVSLKDYIAPSQFRFRAKCIEVGSSCGCVMFVKRFAHECDDEFITDILDNTYNIVVSKHLVRIDKSESLKILKRQMDDLEGRMEKRREINHKRGGSYIPFGLRSREKELTELQEKLGNSNCDLFSFGLYIYLSAENEKELQNLIEFIRQTATRHQVVIDILTGASQQEQGLRCVLPFANPAVTRDGQYIGQPFYLSTDETGNFIPFSYQNVFKKTGLYYGKNRITNTPVIIDRCDGLNANGFTLGTSGGGKSMSNKAEFYAAIQKYPNDEFIIIDPENEYRPLAVPFDAEIIKLSPNSNTHINIFDTDLSYAEEGSNAIAMKSDFVMTFCEAAKGTALTSKERSVVDRCVKLVYQDYLLSDGDKSKIPTLQDFYARLKMQTEKEANDIALSLELFVHGSFDIFAHPTNIQYHKKFIIYDIFEMGEQLQTTGLLVLLELLWQRVIENKKRGVRTWVWCDEFSIMFNDHSSGVFTTGEFFEKIYKRIRKHGGVASAATQNISEVILSKQAMTMLQNSNFLIMLAQKEDDLKVLKKMLNLSDAQAKYLDTDEPGEGLIKIGKKIIPFENKIPKKTLMYKICSTKFKESS